MRSAHSACRMRRVAGLLVVFGLAPTHLFIARFAHSLVLQTFCKASQSNLFEIVCKVHNTLMPDKAGAAFANPSV